MHLTWIHWTVFAVVILSVALSVYHGAGFQEGFADSSSGSDVAEGASQYYDWGAINQGASNPPHVPNNPSPSGSSSCPSPGPEPRRKRCTAEDLDNEEKNKICRNCDITTNKDISRYVLKSSVPPCPNMEDYARKSEVPPWPRRNNYVPKSALQPFDEAQQGGPAPSNSGLKADNYGKSESYEDYVVMAEQNMPVPVGEFYGNFEAMSGGPYGKEPMGVKTDGGGVSLQTSSEISWWSEQTQPKAYCFGECTNISFPKTPSQQVMAEGKNVNS